MPHNPQIHHRRSIRLQEYDYSQEGAYFVTICIHKKEILLGEIIEGQMVLNEYGELIRTEWLKTAQMRENILLDEFVVMPNHFHCIIVIADKGRGVLQYAPNGRSTLQRAPTAREQFGKPVSNSIPTIVRLFKSTTTKQINQIRRSPGDAVWQRNYYEHIIRDEDDLIQIQEYIVNNPLKWQFDHENPINIKS
jgi:REP element-mobilizing transposase RayT